MKIIIINNLYSPWVRGGAERIAEETVAGLEKQGHEVFVIATAPQGSRTAKIYYLSSIFYNLDQYPLWLRFFWHLWDLVNFLNAAKIQKILKEYKPDLVITHNLQGVGYLLPGLLRKMKIKHFHTLHDIQLLHPSGLMIWGKERLVDSLPAKIYQAIMRFLLGSPAVVISPSQWLSNEHRKRGFFQESKTKVLPNYFFKKSAAADQKYKIQNSKFQFIYVGQIEEPKGVKFLLTAFLQFGSGNPAAELTIVGSGSKLEALKKLGEGVENIKILGRKDPREVEELMRAADCLVVPSLCYENSPTVIYEAIAAGLPVIGARLGGITELIEAAGGMLFEPGNIEDLAAKMKILFTLPEESDRIRIKEAAYQPADYIGEILALVKG